MKKYSLFLLCLMAAISLHAQSFADYFADKTLRVDYIFTGNAAKQEICLDGLSCLPSWAGRKHHLSELPLQGNGQIIMRDAANGSVIYKTSFSSLFQVLPFFIKRSYRVELPDILDFQSELIMSPDRSFLHCLFQL